MQKPIRLYIKNEQRAAIGIVPTPPVDPINPAESVRIGLRPLAKGPKVFLTYPERCGILKTFYGREPRHLIYIPPPEKGEILTEKVAIMPGQRRMTRMKSLIYLKKC